LGNEKYAPSERLRLVDCRARIFPKKRQWARKISPITMFGYGGFWLAKEFPAEEAGPEKIE